MREEQRLFLEQAKSSYDVYQLLKADGSLHHCHALHYLQMATELLGKAHAWRSGRIKTSHKALLSFIRGLSTNRKAQRRLGYEGQNENWEHTIRKIVPIAENLQGMAPSLAKDGPNPEYPWPPHAPTMAPVEFDFPIWIELTENPHGRKLLDLIETIFGDAEGYM